MYVTNNISKLSDTENDHTVNMDRLTRIRWYRELSIFLNLLTTLPPPPPLHITSVGYDTLLLILQSIQALCIPPPDPIPRLRFRLTPHSPDRQNHRTGSDVFAGWASHRYEFWNISGETPESFLNMLLDIMDRLVDGSDTDIMCVSPTNQLLITLMWLKQYPTYHFICLIFHVSSTTIWRIIQRVWPILWVRMAPEVHWSSDQEWNSFRGIWSEMPNVVGCIDGTSHRIERPQDGQEEFYSGHRHHHCYHTIVMITSAKQFCYIGSGYLGHCNGQRCYNLMPDIGGAQLNFPDGLFILADQGYTCEAPLVTPYRQMEIRAAAPARREEMQNNNNLVRKRRIYVEHLIRGMKIYRVMSEVYRHPRRHQSSLVELVAGLAQRRARILN